MLVKACLASLRQLLVAVLNRTSQAESPTFIAVLRPDLHTVRNHFPRLGPQVEDFGRRLSRVIAVLLIGQVDHESGVWLVAAEEGGAGVEALVDESGVVGDEGHSAQAGDLRLLVCADDRSAVGEVVFGVGAVVIDDQDVGGALVDDEWLDWADLVRKATIEQ